MLRGPVMMLGLEPWSATCKPCATLTCCTVSPASAVSDFVGRLSSGLTRVNELRVFLELILSPISNTDNGEIPYRGPQAIYTWLDEEGFVFPEK